MNTSIPNPLAVERVRHEIKRRDLQVARVETLSPQMRRGVLATGTKAE